MEISHNNWDTKLQIYNQWLYVELKKKFKLRYIKMKLQKTKGKISKAAKEKDRLSSKEQ